MNINAAWDSQFYQWPFTNGQAVKLLQEHNGVEAGATGKVDLSNPNYFWVSWDGLKKYGSFSKLQMYKLKGI